MLPIRHECLWPSQTFAICTASLPPGGFCQVQARVRKLSTCSGIGTHAGCLSFKAAAVDFQYAAVVLLLLPPGLLLAALPLLYACRKLASERPTTPALCPLLLLLPVVTSLPSGLSSTQRVLV
jgi:hypothetical protein